MEACQPNKHPTSLFLTFLHDSIGTTGILCFAHQQVRLDPPSGTPRPQISKNEALLRPAGIRLVGCAGWSPNLDRPSSINGPQHYKLPMSPNLTLPQPRCRSGCLMSAQGLFPFRLWSYHFAGKCISKTTWICQSFTSFNIREVKGHQHVLKLTKTKLRCNSQLMSSDLNLTERVVFFLHLFGKHE